MPNRPDRNLTWQLTDRAAAAQDVSFVAEAAGDGKLQLWWTDGGEGATYELQRAEQWGQFATAKSGLTERTIVLDGLHNGVPQLFRVRAVGASSATAWSEEIISVPTPQGPAAPDGLEALDYYQGQFYAPAVITTPAQDREPDVVEIRWGQVRGALSYTLERREGEGPWKTIATTKTGRFADAAAFAKRRYTYRVAATNLNGPGQYSLPLLVVRGATAKTAAVFGVGVTNITDTSAGWCSQRPCPPRPTSRSSRPLGRRCRTRGPGSSTRAVLRNFIGWTWRGLRPGRATRCRSAPLRKISRQSKPNH